MTKIDILTLFELAGWHPRIKGDWVMTSCPFAEVRHGGGRDTNPSFGVSIHEDHQSRYNCMACGSKGVLSTLPSSLSFLGNFPGKAVTAHITATEIFSEEDIDEGYLVDMAPSIHEAVLKRFRKLRKSHIKARRITEESVQEFELKLDNEENRMVYPIRDSDGRLVGIRGRFLGDAYGQDVPKYKEYTELSPSKGSVKRFGIWFGGHYIPHPDKAAVLVEGEIDLILMRQQFPNMNLLCAMGASITKAQLQSLESFSSIICFFDNDEAGRVATRKVARYLDGKTPVYKVCKYFQLKDPGDLYEAGKLMESMKAGLKQI